MVSQTTAKWSFCAVIFLFYVSIVPTEAQSIVSGTWAGTWQESGVTVDGCSVNQGGAVYDVTLHLNGTSLAGEGKMTGFHCHNIPTCAWIAWVPAKAEVSGTISSNQIYIVLNANVVDGPCAGSTAIEAFVGTVQSNSIVASAAVQGGSRELRLTRVSVADPKSNGTASKNKGEERVADPIDVATGNMFDRVTDYEMPVGRFGFTRYYNSLAGTNTAARTLGRNWRSNFDRFLRIEYANNQAALVTAERPDGKEYVFSVHNGVWASDKDVNMTLVQSGAYWGITDENDDTEIYYTVGSVGFLVQIQQRGGDVQSLVYNGNNQLVTVSNSFGRALQFTYQTNLLRTLTTSDGLVVTYNYNASGKSGIMPDRLASVTFSTAPTTTLRYVYENGALPFALTGIIDENNQRYATWTYDSYGRALSSQHAGGADFTGIFYNDNDGSRMVTNALGAVTVYRFVGSQGMSKVSHMERLPTANVEGAVLTQTFDTNGYVASETDWNGNVTKYFNDTKGRATNIIEAFGTSQQRSTQIGYHAKFQLPVRIVAPGVTTDFIYDAAGNLLTKTETDTTQNSVPYSTFGQTRSWNFTYNALGQVLTATGPRTDVTAVSANGYDSRGNLIATTNALGQVTRFTQYNNRGLLLTMVDPNGVTNKFTYDIRSRLLSRIVLAVSGNATNTFTYDGVGLVKSITLPDGSRLKYQYDGAHRLRSVSNSLGESIQYIPDALGNVAVQRLMSTNGMILKTQSSFFDQLGRLIRQVGGASQATYFSYDKNGNRKSVTDALNNKTVQAFDPLNRLVSVTDALTNVTQTAFDAQDKLISVSDPRSLVTEYVRDGFGQIIQETSPDSGTTTYILDKAGNRVSQTDARGVVTLRAFDKLDRIISETFPASSKENLTFTYDSTTGGVGRLTGFKDEAGLTTLRYDYHGNLINSTRTMGGWTKVTSYSFNNADRVLKIVYPSGHIVTYTRNVIGNITSVGFRSSTSVPVTVLASNITYLPFGPIKSLVYGNGLARTDAYDADYRLTGITTPNTQQLKLVYNAANNIVAITNLLAPAKTQRFLYDKNNRLTQAIGSYGTNQFSYDGVGNRLTQKKGSVLETYSYSPTANRLQSTVKSGITKTLSYTQNGNIATETKTGGSALTFTYNQRNRYSNLSSNGTQVASYKYNALGERLIKVTPAATNYFYYDQWGHLIAETRPNGAVIKEYVWLDDMPLAQIDGNGAINYVHPDHLNTPQKMTSVTKQVVWESDQQPFGETKITASGVTQNLRFPGQYFDAESGLHYNKMRDYNPITGRYVQHDPIGLKGGIELYGYVRSSPLRTIDPLGLSEHSGFSTSVSVGYDFITGSVDGMNETLKDMLRNWDDSLGGLDRVRSQSRNLDNFGLLTGIWNAYQTLDSAIKAYRCGQWDDYVETATGILGFMPNPAVRIGAGAFHGGYKIARETPVWAGPGYLLLRGLGFSDGEAIDSIGDVYNK